MATYPQIKNYVKTKYGFTPRGCWIAHVKSLSGLPVRKAWNRKSVRAHPCPEPKVKPIKEAFKHFNMI